MPLRRRRPFRLLPLVAALALAAASCSGGGSDAGTGPTSTTSRSSGGPSPTVPEGDEDPVADVTRIEVLSSQPDRISGDDARIRITPSSEGSASTLAVDLDGTDVTGSFTNVDGHLEGVLRGLVEGTNSLTVTGDGEPVTLRLRAWPRQGPMISGPQTPLPACATQANGLGGPGADCAADPVVTFRYVRADGTVAELDDPAALPDGAARVEVDGEELPALVRVERGVVNRSAYETAVLVRGPVADPQAPVPAAWNRTLVYRFEDGCGATYGQGRLRGSPLDGALLAAGYAVATATFNDGQVTCNDVVSTETAMMVKERFVESVGVPDRTIGRGRGLGGGQAHLITQNYPDLLDGVVTVDGFPDVTSFANEIADCLLLDTWFAGGGSGLTPAQRQAVTGYGSPRTCAVIADRYGTPFDPTSGCDPAVPAGDRYSRANPGGLRCTPQDIGIVPHGIDPATGWGVRPLDNVGVQYGLQALADGTISMPEFLDLNERIGGLGVDGALTGERMEVSEDLLQRLYETGRISEGTGDQDEVPVIDLVRAEPGDRGEPGDLHRAIAYRLRVERVARARAPQQIWLLRDVDDADQLQAIEAVDGWLRDREARGERGSTVVPDEAVSRCERADGPAARGEDVFDAVGSACLPTDPAGDPRLAAGAHRTGDVIKCQLKPIDPYDYPSPPSPDELERLHRIFPTGVCDWSAPGAGQLLPTTPDRSFEDTETPADRA